MKHTHKDRLIIPDDIRSVIFKKKLKCILLFIAVLAVAYGVMISGLERFMYAKLLNKIVYCVFCMAVPFAVSGFPFKLIDRYWEGEVVKSNIEFGLSDDDSFIGSRAQPCFSKKLCVLWLSLKTERSLKKMPAK
ncbi:MAG: hypothetical protein E7623_01035 [Ruminococcaceae bacterium]|nr:hypothetical protein [Oscillospiraceae bacterium]